MNLCTRVALFTGVCLVSFSSAANASLVYDITVGADATFQENNTGGNADGFGPGNTDTISITNTSDPLGTITSITIDLPGPPGDTLYFDTFAGFNEGDDGAGDGAGINIGGDDTGASLDSTSPNAITITFTDFDPGETVVIEIDIDKNFGANEQVISTNNFAGTEISVLFDGETFADSEEVDIVFAGTGPGLAFTSSSNGTGTATITPEPTSMALWGLTAVAGLAYRRRRNS